MIRLLTSEVRKNFSDAINRVVYGGERIILRRRRKDIAALVSMKDLRILEQLEDRSDMIAAREALAEYETSGEPAVSLECYHRSESIPFPPVYEHSIPTDWKYTISFI